MVRRVLLNFVTLLFAAVMLMGCEIHQWPEEIEQGPVKITLSLAYEPDLYVWEHRYDPLLGSVEEVNPSLMLFPNYPGTSSKYANVVPSGFIQIYVKVFPASDPSRCVAEQPLVREVKGSYDGEVEIELEGGEDYDVIVWSQLLESAEAQPFYDTSDFNRVRIISANYKGNTDYRDGFRGRVRVGADAKRGSRHVVPMKRPMGKFELITTDLSEFLDNETAVRHLSRRASPEDYRVVISFPMYYPSSYSAMDDRLENAITGVSFETQMTVTGESEASLGFEYVMLNDISDGGVQTRVDVYRLADGTQVASSSMFTIPMRRDHHTILRGAFLFMEGDGGIGIDPGFNGEHNVFW